MNSILPTDPLNKSIEEAAKIAENFLEKLVSPSLEEGGGMLGDIVKYWRFKNKINLTLKTKDFLEKKGIIPAKVPLKTLVPIIENGSLEEDDEMRDKWSAMLAHAADPTSKIKIRPGYPEILKQMSSLEVKLLDGYYESTKYKPLQEQKDSGIVKEKVLSIFGLSSEEYNIIVENLFRLGLCQTPSSEGGVSIGSHPMVLRTYDFIKVTPLGIDFIIACKY